MLALSFWLPEDISTHGHQIDALIVFLHWFMAILFVGWGIFFVYCLAKFRAGKGRTAQYRMIKAKPSKYAEIVVVAVEAVLLIGFAIPVWAAYRGDKPPADKALTVRVVAQQFAWNIHYPGPDGVFGKTAPELIDEVLNPIGLDESDPAADDDVVSVNEFYIPKDRPVIVELSSKDVIHSFSIPVLRIKQDAVPGMMIPIWFEATKTTDELREIMSKSVKIPPTDASLERFLRKTKNHVAMEDYVGQGGTLVLAKGTLLNEEQVATLQGAGIEEVRIGPANPAEIQCAQLCGLGHYRMRGQLKVLEPAAFEEWYATAGVVEEFTEDDFDD